MAVIDTPAIPMQLPVSSFINGKMSLRGLINCDRFSNWRHCDMALYTSGTLATVDNSKTARLSIPYHLCTHRCDSAIDDVKSLAVTLLKMSTVSQSFQCHLCHSTVTDMPEKRLRMLAMLQSSGRVIWHHSGY